MGKETLYAPRTAEPFINECLRGEELRSGASGGQGLFCGGKIPEGLAMGNGKWR